MAESPILQLQSLHVDRTSPIPVYSQISDALQTMIHSGTLAEGTYLPSERELCLRFGVSRMTLRQALDRLERTGLIRSERGRGTFVAPRPIEKQQQEFRSFSEEMASRGATASSRLLSLRSCPPDANAQKFFSIPETARVYCIERLRLADGIPMVVEAIQIQVSLCPDLARFDLEHDSLYRVLEQEYSIHLVRSVEDIGAIPASARIRALLQLPRSTPILEIRRSTYAADDQPIEYACSQVRGDRYRAVVYSSRQAAGG